MLMAQTGAVSLSDDKQRHTHTHARMHTCTHACMHTHAHMHTCMHAHTHARTHAHTHFNQTIIIITEAQVLCKDFFFSRIFLVCFSIITV